MLNITMKGTIWYNCTIENGEQEKMIKEYAEENYITLEQAVMELYSDNKLDELYVGATESEFSTEECESVVEESDL